MCFICDRIEMIKNGVNPYCVKELETGYVVMGDNQHFKGYTLFLCKKHTTELFYLEKEYKMKFLEEMSLVAEAVSKAFHAEKMNYWEMVIPIYTGIYFREYQEIWKDMEIMEKDLSGGIRWKKCTVRKILRLRMNWKI